MNKSLQAARGHRVDIHDPGPRLQLNRQADSVPSALLGDTSDRDYSLKLRLFNEFASPELRQAIAGLDLTSGMQVLDAGCGTGEALQWLNERVAPEGAVWGLDLSAAHLRKARAVSNQHIGIVQAEMLRPPFPPGCFDLIWSVNTLNHLVDPVAGVQVLKTLLRPNGRIAIGQSSMLPDMYFAWDSRLERVTNEAVRQYYRDRYQLNESDLAGIRRVVGILRESGLANVYAKTHLIERVSPLSPQDEAYLIGAVFKGTFVDRVRPYLSDDDYAALNALCDPEGPSFALRRRDFHFLQTFTLVIGEDKR